MGTPEALALGLAFLIGNAFFVGAEFAVLSARRSQIEPKAEAGSRAAATTLKAMEQVSIMLACAQLGVTVCSLGLGAVAEPALAHLIEGPLDALGAPPGLVHPVAFAIALMLVVALHVVLGEMVPKNLAISAPEAAALSLTPVLFALSRASAPVVHSLNWAANTVLRLVRIEPKDEVSSAFTLEEVASIVEESRGEGLLDDRSHEVLGGAFDLQTRRACEVMVPWSQLVTLQPGVTPAQVDDMVAATGFSRFPLVSASGEPEVLGYLHVKDLLYADDERYGEPVPAKRVRTLASVSAASELSDVLVTLRAGATHLARVVDARGATVGLLFLEDVLAELVGEIRDSSHRRMVRAGDRAAGQG